MSIANRVSTGGALVLTLALAACSSEAARTQRVETPPAPQSEAIAENSSARPESLAASPSRTWGGFPEQFSRSAAVDPVSTGRQPSMTPEERALREHVRDLEIEALLQPPALTEEEYFGAGAQEAAEPSLLDEINETQIPEDFSLAENRQERLKATKSDLPLVLNSQVIQFINYFTGRGKTTMVRSLERGAAYRPMIQRVFEEEGLPQELFHLAQAESGFRPKARSRARATGMWQFMAFRGLQYGLRRDRYIDERYDPERATRAAARHLMDLYQEFGDWYLAMAAYNGGPMRVKRGVERSGSSDFWTLSQRRFLLRETRNYVPIILAMTYVAKNLDMYGLEVEDPAPVIEYDTVETDSQIHFDLIADLTGSTPETVKELNPALLRSATPPYGYELRIPKDSSEMFLSGLSRIPEDKRLAWRLHEVKEGESLAAVAKKYRVKEEQIVAVNEIANGEDVASGMQLTIPAPERRVRYYHSSGGAGGLVEGGSGRYRIARGDNLGAIARRFGISVSQLQKWNGLNGTRIIAGRYLIVQPEGTAAPVSASAPAGSGRYRIRGGDTLGAIAKRHGVSVAQLRAWNGLRGNHIRAGDTLLVGKTSTRGSSAPSASTSTRAAASVPAASGGKYKIRRGDSLEVISKRFGVTVADLKSWNGLRGSRITAGEYLAVRPRTSSRHSDSATPGVVMARTVQAETGQRYKIRRGDTLGAIAERFGVTISELKAWNGLRSNRITAGKYLTVRPEKTSQTSQNRQLDSGGSS